MSANVGLSETNSSHKKIKVVGGAEKSRRNPSIVGRRSPIGLLASRVGLLLSIVGLAQAIQFQSQNITMSIRIRFFVSNDDLALSRIFSAISQINSAPLISKFILEVLITKKNDFDSSTAVSDLTAMKSVKIDLHLTKFTPCLSDLHDKLLELKFHSAQVLHIKKLLAEYSQPTRLPTSTQITQPSQEDSTPEIITPTVNSSNVPPAVQPPSDAQNAVSRSIKAANALFDSL